MNTKISVIIPVYNTKLYLKDAIESVLQQKDFIFEIIIIDDGSTDGSGDLLEKLYGKNDIIRIRHTKNNGQGQARNFGTKLATGDFIYYFDSDDIIEINLFNKFHQTFSQIPDLELFCFSGESFLDPKISIEDISNPSELSSKAFKRKINMSYNSGEEAFNILVANNSFTPVPWLYIFKKSILLDNNFEFRTIKYEDEEFTHQLFLFAGKTFISNDIFIYRRVRADSTMQINRTFQDLLGYFQTIETLVKLKKRKSFKSITKKTLNKRITEFVKLIIINKNLSNIDFSKDEKKSYLKHIFPFLTNNFSLLLFNIKYPIEYKLRKIKQKYFPKQNIKV